MNPKCQTGRWPFGTDPYVGDHWLAGGHRSEVSGVLGSRKIPKMKPGWDPGPRPLILCDFLPRVFAAFPSGEVSGAGTDGVTVPSAGPFS